MGAKSSKQHSRGSVFEDLSNDLLLELFDYLSSNEIDLSFGHLNSRLDNLIGSYPQHVNLESNTMIPRHIRSLKITRRYQLPLLFSLDHHQISSIRGLTVANLRSQQLLDVLNVIELKRLEYIYLGVCQDGGTQNQGVESAQTQILALGEYRLRRVHLRDHLLVNIDNLPSTLPALEYVHLDGCKDFCVLSSFLARLPNLKFLRVSMVKSTENRLQPVSCRMTHLILRPYSDCSIAELGRFFEACCSYVEKLVIEQLIRNNERSKLLVSKQEWTRILPRRVTWFHLKNIISAQDYLLCKTSNISRVHDQIWPIFREHDDHPCQAIVEEPFSTVW